MVNVIWHKATSLPHTESSVVSAKSTPSNNASLHPPKSTSQLASGSVQPFVQDSRTWQPDRLTNWQTNQQTTHSVCSNRLLYASPSWWGFAEAQDRQKVYSFLRRSTRVGFYSSDLPSSDDLCIQADQNLFNKVLHNPDHVLHRLLPPVAHTSHNYCLTPCAHDRSLREWLTHLTDCNFIICMLIYQVYWSYLMPACFYCLQLHADSC